MNPKKFWALKNLVDGSGSELVIEGVISQESWWGDEATPQQLRDELKEVKGNKLTVILNSVGGDVFAGLAMFNALRELDAKVTVRVDGVAASIASVIAMAGDEIKMSPGSMMMIHKASSFAWGNSAELEKVIESLEACDESILGIYVDRTGLPKDQVNEMFEAETWFTAEQAVELGFADVAIPLKDGEDETSPADIFGGKLAFSNKATKQAVDSFIKKVQAEGDEPPADPAPEPEVPAGDPAPAVDPPAEVPSEEEPKDDEVTDSPSEETIEPVENGNNNMDPTDPKPDDQVIAPSNQAPVTPTPKPEDYLKTKQSVAEFGQILVDQAGKTSKEVHDAWAAHLAAKGITMGITNPEILLPEPLITKIVDAFEQGGEIWNLVNKTGLTAFRVTRDTVTGEDSRAAGYNRADQATKREELITLEDRVLRPQFIYKYITLNKEDVKENRDTNALVTYVLTELPRRVIREVERAIVIGDGRADDTDYKITSFISIKDDAADGTVFALQYDPAVADSRYETLVRAYALLEADGPVYLVAKKTFLTEIRLEQSVNGGYLFPPGVNIADAFELSGVIKPDWMSDDADNDAYLFVPSAYVTVGDNSIEAFTNFLLSTNKQEYLQEIYAGGGLSQLAAAVAIGVTESS